MNPDRKLGQSSILLRLQTRLTGSLAVKTLHYESFYRLRFAESFLMCVPNLAQPANDTRVRWALEVCLFGVLCQKIERCLHYAIIAGGTPFWR
jgi:hypothetical protein